MDKGKRKFLSIIAEFTTYPAEDIEDRMHFVDDLGIDSLDLAQIILSVESEFDLDLGEDLDFNIETVGDAYALLKEKVEDLED
ncbi:acyl carrier protein [Anaerotalea alkaliphila]|uniref:Acyl carrier protein n=1 Tax=Anaerotalea alkaliphila TaxID=2662126 RepID=A0A7X5KME5_9FIRM|nr:phosphopantetheine-binding protein [Anaerotalea alkaliphila]NDL66869.1 acyl carrier protein [Anaerotalea alkaliphila]